MFKSMGPYYYAKEMSEKWMEMHNKIAVLKDEYEQLLKESFGNKYIDPEVEEYFDNLMDKASSEITGYEQTMDYEIRSPFNYKGGE